MGLPFSSGAKPDVLRQCPTEEVAYAGLGSAVVVTAADQPPTPGM
jgi:hypothetical protein